MAYEQKPDTGTLFTNDRKAQENHPDYNGKLLISRELLQKLAGYGEAMIEVSAWIKETKSGKTIINLQCKEPYKKDAPPQQYASEVIHEPTAHLPAPTKPQYTAEDIARGKLKKFKAMLEACKSLQEVIDLDHQLHEPERWKYFEAVEIIANEAQDLLAEYKEKFMPEESTDHSDLLAKIDVEFQRLGLHPRAHCLTRWNKSRQKLSAEELQIYLSELAIAQPVTNNDDYF